MFLPYAVEDNIERKKNWVKCCLKWKFKYYKGNGNKVSSVGIIVFHVEAA
jgi:hypothetical protein